MKFSDIVKEAREWLQRDGRLTYRVLKREFALDEESLEDLKEQLIDADRVAVDEEGRILVWAGNGDLTATSPTAPVQTQSPASYTPPHLAERIRTEHAAMETRGAADGERKTITALFADLKGSTALIEGLDPEDARAIIDPALQLMMDAVHRYDGYVAQALGDGIFALFGAPIAHEDHPQRALYAALRMQEEMRGYGDQVRLKHGVPLQMRVGINTGEVVVRSIRKDDLHTDYVPVGHSTNLAARMEQLATPGSIVVSEYTRKLTEGYFELKALGAADIKGLEKPLHVYEVLGAGPLRTRFQVTARRGLTRFVGRHPELEQLQRALAQAKAGQGQIVGVMGEPGLGKSRLVHEFVWAVREPPRRSRSGCLVLKALSVSHGKASPYLPIIELLRTYFQIEPTDDERTRRAKVMDHVLTLDKSLADTLPYLFALLGIEEQPSPLHQMDAQIRRQRTFEALKKLFLRESLNQPVLLIFEDLHWIDDETQGFLDTLSESIASANLLLLVNYRPEYRHEWGQKTYYTQLRLAPLGRAEAEELLTFLLGSDASLTPAKQLILDKTQSTPFFMEEVVQTLAEEGALSGERGAYRLVETPTTLQLPSTVQAILAARIDRLAPDEKALLQQLSVIGREFSVSLVKHVIAQPEAELYRLLAVLQHKEFLYEQPTFPEVSYLFKHALTHEVTYNSVLTEQRKALHERTAQALEHIFYDQLEDHYGELAHHYTRGGNTKKAVEYLGLAGQQAVQRSANTEAITALTSALDLLKTLPDTSERDRQELMLQIALGIPLIAAKGYGVPEVEKACTRARELCQQVGEAPQLFPVLAGLWFFYYGQAEVQTAYELNEQCFRLAQSRQDPALLLQAHAMQGWTLFVLGKFVSARAHLARGFALYDSQQHRSLVLLSGGFDPGVSCEAYTSYALWLLGYPEQAMKKIHAALTLAQELGHPFSLAMALSWAATFHWLCREEHLTQERAEASITLSTEQGFPFCVAWGTILRGWVLTEHGQREEGIAQIRQNLAAWRATGIELWRPHFLALLAEAYGKVGQAEEGLAAVAEALERVNETGERWYEAELYRLKGELLLNAERGRQNEERQTQAEPLATPSIQHSSFSIHRFEEVESYFHKAIEVAQKQQAKSLELRAAMSLARLWQTQGKKAEARQRLAEIYGWFTEGFDTKDLHEAKALLEELA